MGEGDYEKWTKVSKMIDSKFSRNFTFMLIPSEKKHVNRRLNKQLE